MAAKKKDGNYFGASLPRGRKAAEHRPAKPVAQRGAPKDAVPIMVMLANEQVVFLDRISASIRERSGKAVKRAALIRAMVDAVREQDVHSVLERAETEEQVKELLKERMTTKKRV